MKICVSIASYRDPFLTDTIESCYSQADRPDHIFTAVLDQSLLHEKINLDNLSVKNQIRYLHISPDYARGVGFARHICQTFLQDEDFYLQIDAHTLFDQHWDTMLIEQIVELQNYHQRPLLTGYPHVFDCLPNGELQKTRFDGVMCLAADTERAFLSDEPVRAISYVIDDKSKFKHGFYVAGGFIFSSSELISHVPYDPHFYFSGEEASLSLRLFTHGYDIFHTSNLPLYHYYGTKNRHTPWSDQLDGHVNHLQKWYDLESLSKQRFNNLVNGHLFGIYGLGTARTLGDYRDVSSIDYLNKKILHTGCNDIAIFSLNYTESVNILLDKKYSAL